MDVAKLESAKRMNEVTQPGLIENLSANPLSAAITIFLFVGGWLFRTYPNLISDFIKSHIKNKNLQTGLLQVNEVVSSVVSRLNATVVPKIKKAAADGKITEAEGKEIFESSCKEIRSQLGPTVIAVVKAAYDWNEEQFDKWLYGKIEIAVQAAKSSLNIASQLDEVSASLKPATSSSEPPPFKQPPA